MQGAANRVIELVDKWALTLMLLGVNSSSNDSWVLLSQPAGLTERLSRHWVHQTFEVVDQR